MGNVSEAIVALAIPAPAPVVINPDIIAGTGVARFAHAAGPDWEQPIGWTAFSARKRRATWLRHDRRRGAPPLAVARVKYRDPGRTGGPWFVIVVPEEKALRHNGRCLFFATAQRAQRAATLASVARCAQETCAALTSLLCGPEHKITEGALHALDAAVDRLGGAIEVAATDWSGAIATPIRLPEMLTPYGREVLTTCFNARPAAHWG